MSGDSITTESDSYALLDSGEEMKLERFGEYVLARPDPQAIWRRRLTVKEWAQAHATYERKGTSGVWHVSSSIPKEWDVLFGGYSFRIKPTSFKHVGLFPEHESNWVWLHEKIKARGDGLANKREAVHQPFAHHLPIKVLNLFGYTGGATLAAAHTGAEVVHVDASKAAVEWGKVNAELSGLSGAHIRWIVDDAMQFVKKEIKRGNTYDAIILDPPAFGHGPKRELWKIERDLPMLISLLPKILTDKPLFVLLNGYAAGYSHHSLGNVLEPLITKNADVETGELLIKESPASPPSFLVVHSRNDPVRLLQAGIFARVTY